MSEIQNSFFDTVPKMEENSKPVEKEVKEYPQVNSIPHTPITKNPLSENIVNLKAVNLNAPEENIEIDKSNISPIEEGGIETDDILPDAPVPEPLDLENDDSEIKEPEVKEEKKEEKPEIVTPLEQRAIKGETMESYYNNLKDTIDKKREEMGVANAPKKFTDDELEVAMEETTLHYRVIEGLTPDGRRAAVVKPGEIPKPKYDESDIILEKDYDSIDFESIKNFSERTIFDGNRRVQVVCVQSGYSCMVGAMNSRELETFGRSEGADTYARMYEMYNSIYRKCSNFSCGNITFNQFMNMTAHPDVETLLYGLYNATFPGQNKYTVYCDNCGKEFVMPVDNHSLLQVAPGSVTMKNISDFLNGTFTDGRAMMKMSKRFRGKVWYSANNTIFFKIGVPSIAKFIENAYHNKKQEVIQKYESDMVYSGYVISVGLLNMNEYITNKKLQWIESSAIENIDRAISKLSPDDKSSFVSFVNNYVQENTVTYQVPILMCPHCKKPSRQKSVPLRELFFAVRDQKEMGL